MKRDFEVFLAGSLLYSWHLLCLIKMQSSLLLNFLFSVLKVWWFSTMWFSLNSCSHHHTDYTARIYPSYNLKLFSSDQLVSTPALLHIQCLVTTTLFIISMSSFVSGLPYMWYEEIILFLCMGHFTQNNVLQVHLHCCECQNCLIFLRPNNTPLWLYDEVIDTVTIFQPETNTLIV